MGNPWLRITEFNVIFQRNISRMHETKRFQRQMPNAVHHYGVCDGCRQSNSERSI